jgi:Flp pilus assembly secretin CpaC
MHRFTMVLAALVVCSTALAAEPVKLFPGTSRVVPTADVTKVAIGDPDIADIATVPQGVRVTAKKGGATTLKVWKKGASAPETLEVQVETAGWNLAPVLVAAKDLAEGTMLSATDLVEVQLPAALFSSSAVGPKSQSYALGHQVLVPVQQGDLVLWSALASKTVALKPPVARSLALVAGQHGTISLKDLRQLNVSDPSVADAVHADGDTVTVTGKAPGVATVELISEGGGRELWTVTVAKK